MNIRNTPILIEGYVSDGEVYFHISGKETRDSARSVDYISETTSTTDSGKKYVADGEAALGSMSTTQTGHTGLTATLWKVIYQNNAEVSREAVNYSTYKATDTVISVGISSGSQEASSIVSKAIQSQDEATIEKAIAQAEADVSAAASKAAASAAGSTTANSSGSTAGSTTGSTTDSTSGNASGKTAMDQIKEYKDIMLREYIGREGAERLAAMERDRIGSYCSARFSSRRDGRKLSAGTDLRKPHENLRRFRRPRFCG